MYFVSILLLTAAATIDSLIIGFNYGVKGVQIGNGSNAFIALVCFAGTCGSMLLGKGMGSVLHETTTAWISGLVFVGLGCYMILSALSPNRQIVRHYSENPEEVDKDRSSVIELRESLMIGLLLTLNNIGLGIGAGLAGIPVLITPIACGVCSFLFVKAGCLLGGRITNSLLSKTLELVSALFILCLGIMELLPLLQ